MKEVHISGNLYYEKDNYSDHLMVRNPVTGARHGINMNHVEPEDLKEAAKIIEEEREREKGE